MSFLALVGLAGAELAEVVGQRACGGADAVLVVVEHDQVLQVAHVAAMVQRFQRLALLQRAVTDHRNGRAVREALLFIGDGNAQRRAEACAAVAGLYAVVGAFLGIREAGDAVVLAQRAELRAPPRQQLVRVALVADVVDYAVALKQVVVVMQGDGQLNGAKAGTQVAAGATCDGLDDELAHLFRQPGEIADGDLLQSVGCVGLFKQLVHPCLGLGANAANY